MKNAVPSHSCVRGAFDIADAGVSRNLTMYNSVRDGTHENTGAQAISTRGNEL